MSGTILLVEDSADDVFFLKQAFKAEGVLNPLQVAPDGKAAKEYLSGSGDYADRQKFPLPDLMLLDLKLPRIMGLEVLRWLRQQDELKTIIVIVLTSSQLVPDINSAYELGVNAYLVKPSSPKDLRTIASGIKKFWLELNQPPAIAAVSHKSVPRAPS